MKALAVLGILFLSAESQACRGAMTEEAQESDASIIFIGAPTAYEPSTLTPVPMVTSGRIAKVSFRVDKTLKGEDRKSWQVVIRGERIPASLGEFRKEFGRKLKVGLRDFGDRIDQGKLPEGFRRLPFIVDNACKMNREDWLLRKVK